jgi:hypothetical protein
MRKFPEQARGEGVATTLAWFPAGDYDDALARWPSLAEDWADVEHDEYCRRFQWELLRLTGYGVPMRGIAPLRLAEYLPWCADEGRDPELPESRAHYAAELTRRSEFIGWPPDRNDPCWCGSGRKYKRCCGTVSYALDDD